MVITIVATLMVMAAYFLVLYGGVGFIQDKRFFSSAHKDILAVIPDKKERFRGAHIIDRVMAYAVCDSLKKWLEDAGAGSGRIGYSSMISLMEMSFILPE
mgnify:CR=1 FL=1